MKKSFKRKYLFECVSERRRKKIVEVEERRRKEIGMMKEDGRRKFDASRFPPHFKQSRQLRFIYSRIVHKLPTHTRTLSIE